MRFKKLPGLVVAVAAVTVGLAPAANADVVTSAVSGGALTVSTFGATLSAVTLNGTTQSSTGTAATWTVGDFRGTGTAWTLTVIATAPTSAAGSPESTARVLPLTGLTVSTNTITAGTDSDPTTNITGSTNLVLSTTSQTLLASSGLNKGSYTLAPSLALSIPANAYRSNYAGAVGSSSLNPYISTVTYTIA